MGDAAPMGYNRFTSVALHMANGRLTFDYMASKNSVTKDPLISVVHR